MGFKLDVRDYVHVYLEVCISNVKVLFHSFYINLAFAYICIFSLEMNEITSNTFSRTTLIKYPLYNTLFVCIYIIRRK